MLISSVLQIGDIFPTTFCSIYKPKPTFLFISETVAGSQKAAILCNTVEIVKLCTLTHLGEKSIGMKRKSMESLGTSETKTYHIISVQFSLQTLPNSFAFSNLAG